jgi:hypothetical protein
MDRPARYSSTKAIREDRRNNVRYPITGLVQFQWIAGDEQWHDAIGTTRDIGKGGVFIESGSIPPVASVLKLIVTIPAESQSDVTLQLGGVGFVRNVRRESYQKIGFGASAVFHTEVPIFKA